MEWLNYHHLRYFWAVAKEGSLTRAAEKMNVSQPSISTQLRLLEQQLGGKLFHKKGRQLALTDTGQTVYGYADEIFSLGRELVSVVQEQPATRVVKLRAGVEDSFPKLLTFEILRPVLDRQPPMHLICHEGKTEDLLAQLAAHRLDMVLTDQPAGSGTKFTVFSHPLGESSVAFCATKALAGRLRRGFPRSLQDAPALLPTQNTSLRCTLEAWFQTCGIRPRVIAEFEDGALMKVAAATGLGVIPVPARALDECRLYFQLEAVGEVKECQERFYLLTAERRIEHPGVAMLKATCRGGPG